MISLRSKKARIANTWVVDKVMKNGVDSTSYYAGEGTVITMDKDGNASATVIQSYGFYSDTSNGEGRWELHENNTVLALILTDLKTNDVDTNWWYITKLKEKELWLEDIDKDKDGNLDEEIQLSPQ